MTLYEFAKLTKDEKASITWKGTFLAHREKNNMKYTLYAVENFFVEVTYLATDNQIIDFQPSQTKRLLEEYLEHIQLGI